MPQLARAALVALFVLVIAVTPLSATFRPAYFEVTLPDFSGWPGSFGAPSVVLEDRTGLVLGMAARQSSSPKSLPDDRLLVVSWVGGCSDQVTWLTFQATAGGYRIDRRVVDNGCPFMIALGRSIVLVLRAPLDASLVEFKALDASVQ